MVVIANANTAVEAEMSQRADVEPSIVPFPPPACEPAGVALFPHIPESVSHEFGYRICVVNNHAKAEV